MASHVLYQRRSWNEAAPCGISVQRVGCLLGNDLLQELDLDRCVACVVDQVEYLFESLLQGVCAKELQRTVLLCTLVVPLQCFLFDVCEELVQLRRQLGVGIGSVARNCPSLSVVPLA